MGRFLTRDTWQGDANRPMSFNRWGYVNENPVNYTDATGNYPAPPGSFRCGTNSQGYPLTTGYDEKVSPYCVKWISNYVGNWIDKNYAPIIDANGQKIFNKSQAQFKVRGHEYGCEGGYDTIKDKNGNLRYYCPLERRYNQNYCGDIIMAALMSFIDGSITADQVIDSLRGEFHLSNKATTKIDQLAEYLNSTGYWSANVVPVPQSYPDRPTFIRLSIITQQIIHLVNINGSTGKVGDGVVNHWVLITGISSQWDYGDESSPWNWIRILNPFTNRPEYYWWTDYKTAWDLTGVSNAVVATIKRQNRR